MYGWTGTRLKVYLTEGKIVKEPLPDELRLNYLGGRGLNSKTLFDELKPDIDPLGPDNVFIVGTGPLNGTAAPTAGRWTVTAKSPLTGGLGDGNGGGDFASELKYAGYDQIIFYGRSPHPVYLWIQDDKIELRDASHLWGKTNLQTNQILWQDHRDREIRVMSIGPAAENLVRLTKVFSNITRCGGKGGMGAVMGSKNLKAVAVRGTGAIKIAKPSEFLQNVKELYAMLMASSSQKQFRETGTMSAVAAVSATRSLSTRNAQSGYFEKWESLTSEVFHSQFESKHRGCAACPISCSHYYWVKEGPYATRGESNEYGTTYPFGSKCGIDNFAAILKMGTICDELGLDTHSTGAVICFAMHCWQEGLLTAKDTDNIDLSWGNADAVFQLLPKIAYRQGFGNILADGSLRASKQINGSGRCLRTVKGMEVSALYLGPKSNVVSALAYATASRGADHNRGVGKDVVRLPRLKQILGAEAVARLTAEPRSVESKGVLLAVDQDYHAVINSLEVCKRLAQKKAGGAVEEDLLAALVSTATGAPLNGDDLMKAGERINNVEKAFNLREGLGREDDSLPPSFFVEEETSFGTTGMDAAKFQVMLDDYYRFRGWDAQGIPTIPKLQELGLGYIAEQIGAA